MSIELGDVVRDNITGFEGVVIGVTKWLHGCRRMIVQPQGLFEGRPIEALSFDEPQLTLVSPKVAPSTGNTGGPAPTPTQRATPERR